MKIVTGSLFVTIAEFLLHFIESSSQAENSPSGDGNVNENRSVVSISPRGRAPPSGRNHETDIDLNPPRSRSSSPDERFAGMILPSPEGQECGIEQLRFIRLVSKWNPYKIFKLRTYTFPANSSLELMIEKGYFESVPARQYIVLSTLNGEVFAILESRDVFVGIYKRYQNGRKRVRINMHRANDNIITLTPDEIIQIPVSRSRPISKNYDVSLEH